jgi:hypothetical protein
LIVRSNGTFSGPHGFPKDYKYVLAPEPIINTKRVRHAERYTGLFCNANISQQTQPVEVKYKQYGTSDAITNTG